MMTSATAPQVEWIPIDRITVANPRVRNKRTFKSIVENIAQVGLKRPITVARQRNGDPDRYDLVCGQGRLEACAALGQKEVPAMVISAGPEDCLVASLVENCARRQHSALDLLQDIGAMRARGHDIADIARQTGLSQDYVAGVSRLLERGEQRLLRAVETNVIPMRVALEISQASDSDVQNALQDAYESGQLRGRNLIAAKKLVESRRRGGKAYRAAQPSPNMSSEALVRAFQEDVERKRDLVRRGNAAQDRLALVTEALRRLLQDQTFLGMLEEEGLTTMPERIAMRMDLIVGSS